MRNIAIKFTASIGLMLLAVGMYIPLLAPRANADIFSGSEQYQPLSPIDDPNGNPVNQTNFNEYLKSMYSIAIGLIFVIGVVVFVLAGIQYIGGEAGGFQKGEAKKQMTAALTGLVIALLSYTILYTINPDLLNFTDINVWKDTKIEPGAKTPASAPSGNSGTTVTNGGGNGGAGKMQTMQE